MPDFVDQEFFHDPDTGEVGDCWRACIASILGYPRDCVPHFIGNHFHEPETEWFEATNTWLENQTGETILYYPGPDAVLSICRLGEPSSRPHLIINGGSPRGYFNHCVVGDAETGAMVHDPHPSRAGVLDITGAFVFCLGADDA